MHYCQISRIIHSWQWADLRFQRQTKSALRSLSGVFRSTFSPKRLDSVGFHLDFNRPLITLWDQRDLTSFVICCTKWISGRLKSDSDRVLSSSIGNFGDTNTLPSEVIADSTTSGRCAPAHWGGYAVSYFSTKHVARHDFDTILIVR